VLNIIKHSFAVLGMIAAPAFAASQVSISVHHDWKAEVLTDGPSNQSVDSSRPSTAGPTCGAGRPATPAANCTRRTAC
jgi:hypothetical protein